VITHVEVTPSSGSDAKVTLRLLETLAERSIQPEELWADTTYGSGHNAFEAERQGTELISPVGGPSPVATAEPPEASKFTSADFEIDARGGQATVCPAGHEAIAEYEDEERPQRVEIYFASTACTPCSLQERCPVKFRWPELAPRRTRKAFILRTDLVQTNIVERRRAQTEDEWRKRYGLRAGIEATNSELKRAHGLGKLRVRGSQRVRLAVYLKALACNFKRMIAAIQEQNAPEAPSATSLTALAA
jgi:Transposase DDE domain